MEKKQSLKKSDTENLEDCLHVCKTFLHETGVSKSTVYRSAKPFHLNPQKFIVVHEI